MIFELADIEPGSDSDDDVIVTVRYYEGDSPRGNSPVYEEEHEIIGIPAVAGAPVVTPLGQFVGLDGSPVSPWKVVDGELTPIDPHEIRDQIQWDEESEEDLLLSPVRSRAQVVKSEKLKGRDVGPTRPRRRGRGLSVAERLNGLRGHFEEI